MSLAAELIEYPDRDMMMFDLANQLAGELKQALLTHERVSFVVPGGSTPGPVFDVLCAVHLDWERVTIFPSDERWVPESSPRSNANLIRKRLLTSAAAAAEFIPFYTGDAAPEMTLDGLNARLASLLPISVLLLGMGADLHTASLFPGANFLTEALSATAPPVMALHAPGVSEPRITLTAPVLSDAMSSHIVISGEEKRRAYERASELSDTEAPVKTVIGNATLHWAP